MIERQQLGLTKERVLRLGFGCAPMGGYDYGKVDDRELIGAVRKARELGIDLFDTADIYGFGRAETLLAKALGNDRKKVVLATKVGLKRDDAGKVIGDCSPEHITNALEKSLRRLKVEAITLYQIHRPDPATRIEETMEALLACQKAGKIKYLGCSNFDCALLQQSQKSGRLESLQVSYNLLDRKIEKDTMDYCKQSAVSVLTHSSLARGFLTGKYMNGFAFEGTDTRKKSKYFSDAYAAEKKTLMSVMMDIAQKSGKTMAQIAVRWIVDNPAITCAIVGFKNADQLSDLFGSLEWKLSPEDYKNLSDLTNVFIN